MSVSPSIVAARPAARPVRLVMEASRLLLAAERHALVGLMGLLMALILLNVATRYLGVPLYWVDESAVYSVVWLTFIGASAMTRLRLDFAVTMLTERLPASGRAAARVVATAAVVGFGLALAWMCWLWMDPPGLVRAGFDARALAAETFNFLYTERTQTLNWPTWVLYLILPLFSVSLVVHGLALLAEDLGLAERAVLPRFGISSNEGIN